VAYLPASAKYKVYIIDEVHMLSDGAFNALLKTLEEPPAHVIFILATTEVHKIPATIISRCQRYDFARISANVIADRLRFICDTEGFTAEDNALRLIAKLADGGMRDAVSMLDLCSGVSGEVTEKSVADAVGLIDKSYLFDIVNMIEAGDTAGVLGEVNRLYSASCDMERLCSELVSHYRDLMIAKSTAGYRELITATNEELDKIGEQSKTVGFDNMLYATNTLSECIRQMKSGSDKRCAVETALIRLCVPRLEVTLETLSRRVSALEEKLSSGNIGIVPSSSIAPPETENDAKCSFGDETAAPVDNNAADNAAAKPKADENAATADDSEQTVRFDGWAEVLEQLADIEPMLHGVLDGSAAYLRGDYLLIDAQNEQFRILMNSNRRMYASIKTAMFNVSGKRCKIGPYNKQTAQTPQQKVDPLDKFAKNNSDIVSID
ncbi:MAG: DNA polymerase III subunit gamma/tau, partial [Acutalibacteraceae bacterium]